jgi:anaphase-promoting complex subunit 2
MTASIMATAPPSFYTSCRSVFRKSLHTRESQNDNDAGEGDDNNENTTTSMDHVSSEETILFQSLHTLGWVRPTALLHRSLLQAIHQTILAKVKETIAGDFESAGLYDSLLHWKDTLLVPWLQHLLGPQAFAEQDWSQRLVFYTAECYCLTRMDEIFDVVADYPDSNTAVEELRIVLETTKMQNDLGRVLCQSLDRRLNHPGANTSQIIDVYIATIKVLRVIDPSDRLLAVVAEPVRSYLRGRHDTVRCIITSLTNADVGGDLYEELRRQDAKPLENVTVDSDDEEEPPDFDWQPPPSINKPRGTFLEGGVRGSSGDSDILAMLVSIYGSKELFVNEYRLMLADKLLANLDYNTDKEVHTLELLKLRFGEMSLRNCEVMIKDMDDSKRANANIVSTLEESAPATATTEQEKPVVDAAMISHIFWPTLQNEQLKHHPRIQYKLDEFGSAYARLKNPRRLIWLNQLGTVQLQLDVVEKKGSRSVVEKRDFTVTPVLSTLILHFESKSQWTPQDLSNETGIPEHIIQRRMAYWVNQRVIVAIHSPGGGIIYEIATIHHQTSVSRDMDSASMMDDDVSEGQAASAMAQEAEERDVYQSYILNMLTTLKTLPLEKIHNNLKMFATGSDHKYNMTVHQLSGFLQHLCKQERLECGPDGDYKVFKK